MLWASGCLVETAQCDENVPCNEGDVCFRGFCQPACNPLLAADPCFQAEGTICRRCDGNRSASVVQFLPEAEATVVSECRADANCNLCDVLDCTIVDPIPNPPNSLFISESAKTGGNQCSSAEDSTWLCSNCTCNPICNPEINEICIDGGCVQANKCLDDPENKQFCLDSPDPLFPHRVVTIANKRICKHELFVDLNSGIDDICTCTEDCPCEEEDPTNCPTLPLTGPKLCVDGCFLPATPCGDGDALLCVGDIALDTVEGRRVCNGQVFIEVGD